jgi:hypothetical protein
MLQILWNAEHAVRVVSAQISFDKDLGNIIGNVRRRADGHEDPAAKGMNVSGGQAMRGAHPVSLLESTIDPLPTREGLVLAGSN